MTTARQFPDREPEPIRRSDLPPTRPAEWEFHTWFPHPDGGGDMVRGQRQRGVQVRRRVTYGDWEPVHPDRWTDEPTGQETSAATEATIQPEYRALLARLNEEQAHYAEAAARTTVDECVISHSSKAHAFKIAAAHTLAVFEGPEAANAYMRDGGKPPAQGAFVPPPARLHRGAAARRRTRADRSAAVPVHRMRNRAASRAGCGRTSRPAGRAGGVGPAHASAVQAQQQVHRSVVLV